MAIFLTVIITIFVIGLLELIFAKLGSSYLVAIIKKSIDISCYIDTYHYHKDTSERVEIGQKMLYKEFFGERKSNFVKDKIDYIFWVFYTHIFDKLLDTVPISVTRHNNRCLSEGEVRGIEKFLDEYLEKQENKYEEYATDSERRKDSECISEANSNE